jgi:hypothetical protein
MSDFAQNGDLGILPSAPPGSMFRSVAVAGADLHIGGRGTDKAEAERKAMAANSPRDSSNL